MNLKNNLIELGACGEATEWVGDRTPEEAWGDCPRGDWLLWILVHMAGKPGWPTIQKVVQLARTFTDTVADTVAGMADVASVADVADVADAAANAAYTAAHAAADAAYTAAIATEISTWIETRNAELLAQANYIRGIVTPPTNQQQRGKELCHGRGSI